MATVEELTNEAIENARSKAEHAIEEILIELDYATCCKISHVMIDTRNFANYDCEITFQDRR